MTPTARRARTATAALALLALAAAPLALQTAEASDAAPVRDTTTHLTRTIGDPVSGLADLDRAGAAVAPTALQKSAATALGTGVTVQWNAAGTPASISAADGVLAAPTGAKPVDAARAWVSAHRDLLGLTAEQAQGLELVTDQEFAGSDASAVLLRQRIGGLVPATRGMVTVGVAADGAVSYVSSSLLKPQGVVPAAVLNPLQGWLAAAANVGRPVTGGALARITSKVAPAAEGGWTRLGVPGFAQTQLARLRAYVTNDGSVRPVIESDVIDSSAGTSTAYRVFVDAVSSSVLLRQNAVENSSDAKTFTGSYTSTSCGQPHAFALTDANTKTITALANSVAVGDDITIKLTYPLPRVKSTTSDTLTSPEVAVFNDTFLPGTYTVQVCPFDQTSAGGNYSMVVASSDLGASVPTLPQPAWRAFAANPTLASTKIGTLPTNTVVECWKKGTATCAAGEDHENVAAFGAWDTVSGVPTMTTIGNNANTHEAWLNPLAPGGLLQAPVSVTRQYTTDFKDIWNEKGCDPAQLVPGGNDINAVVTNLFVGHNRIHDFAYYLGFTESNYNLQLDNGGRGGVGGDQEIGNVQAGAIDGGSATTGLGRDNANQIALQDGVPGITNQYLFQPLAGSFYSPCADGALDTGIYGHEYTHAISNRMVGGPDDGLTSEQGGAMGESWSDLNASEYEFENGYDTGTVASPWVLGAYATGNPTKGIRDYAINNNPLNYSDYGFDTTGKEVHADGEIWNGTQWEVRQALVNKYDALGFKYADTALQEQCSTPSPTSSPLPASSCPGNRRWLQLIYDAWLLQQGDTDMLTARDAMIAADQMRFGGADVAELSAAFARRGMGADASTDSADTDSVVPSFRSAYGKNSTVTFTSTTPGKVYVGDYEARATPIADTSSAATSTATFTPGIYRMTFASPTAGFRRFVLTVGSDGVSFTQAIDDSAKNVASSANGATIISSATTTGSLNADSLIDGTEATNWGVTTTANVDVAKPAIAVDLPGTAVQTITSAKVSALLRPAPASTSPLPVLVGQADDPDSGSRFTALRKFALQACTANCTDPASYTTFFTSPDDAFPAVDPRPVSPDQLMRTFTFPAVQAAAVRLVALDNQCTGQDTYAGELDQDPTNATDCNGTDRATIVHASELQLFAAPVPTDPTPGTPGDGNPGSGDAGQGTNAPPVAGQPTIGTTTTKAGTKQLVKTRTRIRLPKVQQVQGQQAAKLLYQVVAKVTSNGAKAGVATIRIDGKKYKKVTIAVTLKHGKKVIGKKLRLPRSLTVGRHTVQVKFKSADPTTFSSSKSRRIVVTVVR